MIKSFALIAERYRDWKIDIYGRFHSLKIKKELEDLMQKYNLKDQVFFKDITNNPMKTMLDYDFCIFPSFFEGFPNVIR